jgi:hypothetical protein
MSESHLLTALSTEHFTLQGARAQTMSESSARASLYIISVSSTLVALGFIAQVSTIGDLFNVFALTVLPTLYVLGTVTFVRLVECSAEDLRYGLAINRIRAYYKEIAGHRGRPVPALRARRPRGGARQHGTAPAAASADLRVLERCRGDQRRCRGSGDRGGGRSDRRRPAGRCCGCRRRGGDALGGGLDPVLGPAVPRPRRGDRAPLPILMQSDRLHDPAGRPLTRSSCRGG